MISIPSEWSHGLPGRWEKRAWATAACPESQRDSSLQPRVARHELPWEIQAMPRNPEGVDSGRGAPTPAGHGALIRSTVAEGETWRRQLLEEAPDDVAKCATDPFTTRVGHPTSPRFSGSSPAATPRNGARSRTWPVKPTPRSWLARAGSEGRRKAATQQRRTGWRSKPEPIRQFGTPG